MLNGSVLNVPLLFRGRRKAVVCVVSDLFSRSEKAMFARSNFHDEPGKFENTSFCIGVDLSETKLSLHSV